MARIGIIGGSGLEDPDILKETIRVEAETRYGPPSSELVSGTISGCEVIIISRHGSSHTIPPTQVNNRANITALQKAGCTHIIATTACGSLREEIGRGDIVIPDQFIDFTKNRETTFFDSFEAGEMKHTPMADPFDKELRMILFKTAVELGLTAHDGGTVVTIEGPRFSTRAESHMFRTLGADLVNMSTCPEAILANEVGIPYAAIAMSTDYDSWKDDEEPVSWVEVLRIFGENVHNVVEVIKGAVEVISLSSP